jgi:hypothetical protein
MRAAAYAIWGVAGVVLLLVTELRGQPVPSIVGQWLVRNDQMEVRAEFRADGTFTRVTRSAQGTETVVGTYRLADGVLELKPQGATETIKLKYRMPDANTLELTGEDGSGVQMIRQGPANPGANNPGVKPAAKAGGRAVIYRVYHYIDVGGLRDPQTGQWLEGFSLLVPKGWAFTGGFRWMAREKPANMLSKTDLLNPVKSDYTITSPDGSIVIRQYPVEYWVATNAFPPGANYSGMIVCPAVTPEQYITQFVIPRQRGGQLQDLRIVKQEPLDQLAAMFDQESRRFDAATGGAAGGSALTFKAGAVTIEYTENGAPYRERFICIQQYMQTAGLIMWWPRGNCSVRAPRDQFDAMIPVFATVATSIRTNPRWSVALIELRQHVSMSLAQADEYCHRIQNEIAQAHSQTIHELARDEGYLSGDYYDYKGTDGNRYTLPTDEYHFMNQNGDILSQDDSVPPSSEWTSIEPYNQ